MESLAQTQPQVTHKFFNGSMRPVALIPPYITTRRQAMDELGLPRHYCLQRPEVWVVLIRPGPAFG